VGVGVRVWLWIWVGSRKARVVETLKSPISAMFAMQNYTELTSEEILPVAHRRSKERIASGRNAQ